MNNGLPRAWQAATICSMTRTVPLLLLCAAANAATVAQFRAEDFGAEWPSTRGTAALRPVHAPTNGWCAATPDRGGVSFALSGEGPVSPLAFDAVATGMVSRVWVVADCTEARPWSTLLDAPTGASFPPRPFPWEEASFAASNALGSVSVSVDGEPDAPMPLDGTPHLVEIAFPEPVAATELYLGGHPATPAWDRSWRGRVFEALFCFGDMAAEDAAAVRPYLSLRHGLGLGFAPPPDIAARLRNLGVDSGALYPTLVIMR